MSESTNYQGRSSVRRSACFLLWVGLFFLVSPAVAGAVVQPTGESAPETAGTPAKIDHIPEFATDEAACAKGRVIFENAIAAYRKAPALRDNATVRSISTYAGNSSEDSFAVPLLLADEALWIKLNEGKFTVIDNTIYGEVEREPGRLYVHDFTGPITADLFVDILYLFPIIPIPLRYSADPLEDLFLANIEPKIAGQRRVYLAEAEAEFDEILISSTEDGAPLELRFDPQTGLLTRFRTVLRDPNLNETDGTEIIVEFQPEVLAEVPLEEFIIELADRREVDSLGALYLPPNIQDLIQKPAPNFTLQTLEGETIESETLVGNVLVLAFWQIAHEELFPVLPALNKLTEWRNEEGKSVEIFAVNAGDPLDLLRTIWNEKEYALDLLLDPDLKAAQEIFKIGVLPTVIVITADGLVQAVQANFDYGADIYTIIKESTVEALNQGI